MTADRAAVLHRLPRVRTPALVRRLPVRRLDVAPPGGGRMVSGPAAPIQLRLLELGRPGGTRNVGMQAGAGALRHQEGGTGGHPLGAQLPLVQVEFDPLEVAQFVLDLLRHPVSGGRVHLRTTTFISILYAYYTFLYNTQTLRLLCEL